MGFLSLPLELRQQIICDVICLPSAPPPCPSASQARRRRPFEFNRGFHRPRGIWQLPLENPAGSLLVLSRQLHVEVRDVLRRLRPRRYQVDIMFVKTHGLWPTWTLLPVLAPAKQFIPEVSCTFRLFEPTPDLDGRFRNSLGFRMGDGGPPLAAWSFYDFLRAFFDLGPGCDSQAASSSSSSSSSGRPRYVVGTLFIDVLAPTDGAAHTSVLHSEENVLQRSRIWLGANLYGGRRHDSVSAEEELVRYLDKELSIILKPLQPSADYGKFLYECLRDRIVFMVNGREYKSYDMQKTLVGTPDRHWAGHWKPWVLERRRKLREGVEVEDDGPLIRKI